MANLTVEQFEQLMSEEADLAYNRFVARLKRGLDNPPIYTETDVEEYEALLARYGFTYKQEDC